MDGLESHETKDRLAAFLYDLMKCDVPPGTVHRHVAENLADASFRLTNGHLGRYAEFLAGKLRRRVPAGTMVRFESSKDDASSKAYGPFPFVQLTYTELRVGPDGDVFASIDDEEHLWHIETSGENLAAIPHEDRRPWSDVVIYEAESYPVEETP